MKTRNPKIRNNLERFDAISLLKVKLIDEEATAEDVLAICALLPSLITLVKALNARNKSG